jgi:dipeptidase E
MSLLRKLALFSDDQEVHANEAMNERLLRLIGRPRAQIGYIPEASDPARVVFDRKRECYAQMGAELSVYFDEDASERERMALLSCDAIHLSGGNTFTFLYWLRERGLLPMLRRYVAAGGVLVGVSAGAILMTPSVRSSSLCGDPPDERLTDYAALGLVDFHFWPHFDPACQLNGEQSALAESLPKLHACPGGAGIIVEGDAVELFGPIRQYRSLGNAE